MPIIEGTTELKTIEAEYDFAKDGGVQGDIVLHATPGAALGNNVPNGSVVVSGYVDVITPPTSGGAGTLAIKVEGAADLVAAAAVSGAPWSTTGRKSIIPAATGATSVKTTATRMITATVAAFDLTAGKFRVVLVYR